MSRSILIMERLDFPAEQSLTLTATLDLTFQENLEREVLTFIQRLLTTSCLIDQLLVDTIKSVGEGKTVRISTMDWLGQSQYAEQTVYWSTLSSTSSEGYLECSVLDVHGTIIN